MEEEKRVRGAWCASQTWGAQARPPMWCSEGFLGEICGFSLWPADLEPRCEPRCRLTHRTRVFFLLPAHASQQMVMWVLARQCWVP